MTIEFVTIIQLMPNMWIVCAAGRRTHRTHACLRTTKHDFVELVTNMGGGGWYSQKTAPLKHPEHTAKYSNTLQHAATRCNMEFIC